MKSSPSKKRQYRGTVQAQVAELTRQRLFDAALTLFIEVGTDDFTLKQIAERAGVTVQTILRHYKSKQGFYAAAGKYFGEKIMQQRDEAPVGDITGALSNLMEHYETVGRMSLRNLALEGRTPELDEGINRGRNYHHAWVERVFAPFISHADDNDRERLIAQLVAICDVYTWKLLRLDSGLTRDETELALHEMLTSLLREKNLLIK